MEQVTMKECYTPEELKQMLRLKSTQTLANWRHMGKGPPFSKAGGRKVVYRREAVQKWLEQNERTSTLG